MGKTMLVLYLHDIYDEIQISNKADLPRWFNGSSLSFCWLKSLLPSDQLQFIHSHRCSLFCHKYHFWRWTVLIEYIIQYLVAFRASKITRRTLGSDIATMFTQHCLNVFLMSVNNPGTWHCHNIHTMLPERHSPMAMWGSNISTIFTQRRLNVVSK